MKDQWIQTIPKEAKRIHLPKFWVKGEDSRELSRTNNLKNNKSKNWMTIGVNISFYESIPFGT